MMPEPPDGVPDRRRPPFCYQTIDALAAIRATLAGSKLVSALGIYLVLTEVANAKGGAAARGGFRATRKEIAKSVGVSIDTLDRYVTLLEEAGVLRVEKRMVDGVNLPNVWALVDPPGRSDAATPSRTGAAQVPKETHTEEEVPPVSPPSTDVAIARPANRPETVARRPVTDHEYETAVQILEVFNHVAGTAYSSVDWVAKIISRLREHPGLTIEAHDVVIRRAFAGKHWWTGPPSPSIVYGNAAHFERCVHAVLVDPAGPGSGGLTAEEMEAQDG